MTTCERKTLRGNSYPNRRAAQCVAERRCKTSGLRISAYHCAECGVYHVGKKAKLCRKLRGA